VSDNEVALEFVVRVGITAYVDKDEEDGWTDDEIREYAVKEVERILLAAREFSPRDAQFRKGPRSHLGYFVDFSELEVD
jgi:hypothetical protein